MKILIKYAKEEIYIEICGSKTIKDLKQKIAELKNCKFSSVRLIYKASVLKNAQIIDSVYVDPKRPIDLYIIDSTPKKDNQMKSESSSSNVLDQKKEFADYFSGPKMKEMLLDPEVQIGFGLILQGLTICQESGNNYYDTQLDSINNIYHDPAVPTPPPSQSNSMNSLQPDAINENHQKDNDNEDHDIQYFKNAYSSQLREMEDMGFQDEAANLQALIQANGDLDDAVIIIIGQN